MKEALSILHDKLSKDGMGDFIPILSETRVKDAIRDGIRNFEAYCRRTAREQPEQSKSMLARFEQVKSLLQSIATDGAWSDQASFRTFSELGTDAGTVSGLWVRLGVDFETADHKPSSSGVSILDLSYGYIH